MKFKNGYLRVFLFCEFCYQDNFLLRNLKVSNLIGKQNGIIISTVKYTQTNS